MSTGGDPTRAQPGCGYLPLLNDRGVLYVLVEESAEAGQARLWGPGAR